MFERRVLQAREVRAAKSADGKPRVSGYAATYGTMSSDLGGFFERIAPGAFNRILRTKPDVVCVLNHNENFVLGRTTSGTLRIKGDAKGLYFECDLPNTQAGRDTYESVQRGDLCGCSFAFTVDNNSMCEYTNERFDPEFDEDEEGVPARASKLKDGFYKVIRTIKDFANLIDVSVVTHPAYPGTSVDARNLVAAECRSSVAARQKAPKVVPEETAGADVRRRRQGILDLL